jgi:Gpi18-like mannosyltransferase
MVYIWAGLGAVEPAFRTVSDAADEGIRVLMKAPPSLADLGLALGVAYGLRTRPTVAVLAALGIALHPAVIDVSALFGQYESIYVMFGLGAFLLAVNGHPRLAAVALGLALMTKPQALPFVAPFAAWSLATLGWRETARLVGIGLAVVVVTWLPFIPFGGPAGYLRSLEAHQNDLFAVLSLRAWNPWWILQSAAGGEFLGDSRAILGPLTPRHLGLVAFGLLELVVFAWVYRRPTPTVLAWALAASSIAAFLALTTMHERYAYPVLVFLALAFPDRRAVAVWIAFGIVFTVNLLAAVPPSDVIGDLLPSGGVLGLVGSIAMTAIGAAIFIEFRRAARLSDGP